MAVVFGIGHGPAPSLLGSVGDGATVDIRSFFSTDVGYIADDPIETSASVGTVGYASNGFDMSGWATFVPTATPTATAAEATPAERNLPAVDEFAVVLGDGEAGSGICSYPWPCEWALAVIECESGGDPNAYNPAGPYVGLFQVWEGYGGNLYDPAVNVAVAWELYQSGGAGHWPHCP